MNANTSHLFIMTGWKALSLYVTASRLSMYERQQGLGIDTIKYYTCRRIPNGKVTKSQ